MNVERRAKIITAVLTVLAISGSVAFGVAERLKDPLSSSVVPAEDPYTHMILVRGHLRDGNLDPVFPGGTMYPPGMHAVLAATWVYTGLDLYDIFRVGPVVFGGLSILGIALLVGRHHGPLAGSVAALATALAPELIFRTTMMAPTALDLAILPFILVASVEALRGHRLWVIPVTVMLGFLVMSHPWMLAIFGPLLLAWILVSLIGVWWGGSKVRVDPIGAALLLVSAGAGLIAAVTVCWGDCGLRYEDLVVAKMAAPLDRVSILIGAMSFALAVAIYVLRDRIRAAQASMIRWPMGFALRLGVAVGLVGALFLGTITAVQNGMPEYVDLPRMYGWGVLGLAAIAAACTPFIRGHATLPLAGLAVVTYPFVIYNPLDSPYWPHRTAAYLGIALVGLAGIGAGAIVRALRIVVEKIAKRLEHRVRKDHATQRANRARAYSMGAIATIVGATLMAGTVYAATPLDYENGWYRLYPDCEFDVLRSIAEDSAPDTVIVTASWQSKLVTGAFADDGMNVWYSYEMFTRDQRRENTLRGLDVEDRDLIMVMDRYLRIEHAAFDTTFLHEEPFEILGEYCAEGLAEPRLTAYIARGGA